MFIKLIFPFIILINYFTIFYICYADKEYKSIEDYPGFFSQYFLLGISYLLHNLKIYKLRNIKNRIYFTYQIAFLIYTLIASFAVPNYIFNYNTIDTPYLVYLCGVGLLSLTKLRILYTIYKEERELLPFHQI